MHPKGHAMAKISQSQDQQHQQGINLRQVNLMYFQNLMNPATTFEKSSHTTLDLGKIQGDQPQV